MEIHLINLIKWVYFFVAIIYLFFIVMVLWIITDYTTEKNIRINGFVQHIKDIFKDVNLKPYIPWKGIATWLISLIAYVAIYLISLRIKDISLFNAWSLSPIILLFIFVGLLYLMGEAIKTAWDMLVKIEEHAGPFLTKFKIWIKVKIWEERIDNNFIARHINIVKSITKGISRYKIRPKIHNNLNQWCHKPFENACLACMIRAIIIVLALCIIKGKVHF